MRWATRWSTARRALAEGLALIERAHKLSPDDPFILDSMGWAQFRHGQARRRREVPAPRDGRAAGSGDRRASRRGAVGEGRARPRAGGLAVAAEGAPDNAVLLENRAPADALSRVCPRVPRECEHARRHAACGAAAALVALALAVARVRERSVGATARGCPARSTAVRHRGPAVGAARRRRDRRRPSPGRTRRRATRSSCSRRSARRSRSSRATRRCRAGRAAHGRRPARRRGRLGDADRARARLPAAGRGLAWWVRGAPRAGAPHSVEADGAGRPVVLRQDGWEIVYGYADDAARRPSRLDLACHDLEVRIVIDRWRVSVTRWRIAARAATMRRMRSADRSGAGQAQSVPARHRAPRRRLSPARIAVRRARLRRHDHAHAPRRRRDRAHDRSARRSGAARSRGARGARAPAGDGLPASASTSRSPSGFRMGGGLGGGSSDAATVLLALNRLWRGRPDARGADADRHCALGADVPFFLCGEPARRARHRRTADAGVAAAAAGSR